MTGKVDAAGRALVPVLVRATTASAHSELDVWVDTAFDGELVLPFEAVAQLGLVQSAAVRATLADGTTAILETFRCFIQWHTGERCIEAIANGGNHPLVGIGLLKDHRLVVDYPQSRVVIE